MMLISITSAAFHNLIYHYMSFNFSGGKQARFKTSATTVTATYIVGFSYFAQ
jgi:hypothetical protein